MVKKHGGARPGAGRPKTKTIVMRSDLDKVLYMTELYEAISNLTSATRKAKDIAINNLINEVHNLVENSDFVR